MRRDSGAATATAGLLHSTTGRRVTGSVAAVATPALVQSASVDFELGAAVVTLPESVTAGHLIAAMYITNDTNVVTVTDSQSNAYTPEAYESVPGLAAGAIVWAVCGSSGPLTVTGTSTADNAGLLVYEISGLNPVTPVDQSGGTSSSTDAPVVGQSFTGLAGTTDFVIYWATYNPPGNTPAGGIWTSDYSVLVGGGNYTGAAWAVTGPNVTAPAINPGQSSVFTNSGVAFKP